MPVRNWSDGDLLTSAALNELTTSMYQRFADYNTMSLALAATAAPGTKACALDSNITWTFAKKAGLGYWLPQSGTLCFFATQAAAQTTPANTWTVITGFGAPVRNFNSWFNPSTGRFTPLTPGFYEFFGGGSSQTTTPGTNTHRVSFRFNSTGVAASEHDLMTPNIYAPSFNARKLIYYMNGTTDYMEIAIYPAVATSTAAPGGQSCSFGAKFQGW